MVRILDRKPVTPRRQRHLLDLEPVQGRSKQRGLEPLVVLALVDFDNQRGGGGEEEEESLNDA